MILQQTCELLQKDHSDLWNSVQITDARVGVYMTAVVLSDGSAGVAATDLDPRAPGPRKDRYFGPFSPGMINGCALSQLFETDLPTRTASPLRLAAMNALSSSVMARGNYNIRENADPMELLDLSGKKNITIVGAFQSYIRKLSAMPHRLRVLELNEDALDDDQKQYYVPAENYAATFRTSDIIIITGFTLVNGTIDSLLESIPPGRQVVVVGPSGNLLPEVLFSKGVNIIGATRITNPSKLLEVVSQGGTGFHLFRYCAQKICILNET
jgi:uncharacterized protein